jgi:hypothetical protein
MSSAKFNGQTPTHIRFAMVSLYKVIFLFCPCQLLFTVSIYHGVDAFSVRPEKSPWRLNVILFGAARRIEIPLLDRSVDDDRSIILPLPSAHLPSDELAMVHALPLTVPLHHRIIDHACEAVTREPFARTDTVDPTQVPLVGIVAWKPSDSTMVGAIGCTAQILLWNGMLKDADEALSPFAKNSATTTTQKVAVVRGLVRFVVREIVQSIPYAVAVVEELLDDEDTEDNATASTSFNEDSTEDEYATLTTKELMQRTLQFIKSAVDLQLEQTMSSTTTLSPLEQSILQDGNMISQQQLAADAARDTAEERAAIWDVFQSVLVDEFVTPRERWYAVALMAAELCSFDNATRRQMLCTTNTVERLRMACAAARRAVSWQSAQKLATTVTDTIDASSKDLVVGAPRLPPWAQSIRKGTKVEYYWNEEYAWCRGTVVEEPLRIVDYEMVLTVYFPDDGTTHRLPFSAEEKARWRPG